MNVRAVSCQQGAMHYYYLFFFIWAFVVVVLVGAVMWARSFERASHD